MAIARPGMGGWVVAWLVLALAAIPFARSHAAAGEADPQLAYLRSPADTALPDLLSGEARLGFTPIVDRGLYLVGQPDQSIWLRLRLDAPADASTRFLTLPRGAIDRLRLWSASPAQILLAQTGIGAGASRSRWPDLFVLPLPQETGPTTLYLEIQGQGYLNLRPQLMRGEHLESVESGNSRMYDLLYLLLFGVLLTSVLRRSLAGDRTLRVAAATLACLGAAIVGNYHIQLSLGGISLAAFPAMPVALWVMACAPLVWATQQQAGLDKSQPELSGLMHRFGLALLLIGGGLLLFPVSLLAGVQVAGLALLAITALVCAAALLAGQRRWRWGPVLICFGLAPALLAIPLAMAQVLPPTSLATRGFQLLLALLLVTYLAFPWLDKWLEGRVRRRMRGDGEGGQSAEQQIAHAREWMISSLQAGIASASDGDMEWIAYRRLMGGLKPVLPQTGAAVIAMNYHNEDLLLVEPKSVEARFQMLLAQRGSLLKNLSRSLAPQQIGVDFVGPEGPLQQVLLAVIPLPIDRPGWGVLVIERSANVSYSDDELDLCTEFAALATTAGDEASAARQMRQASEIDPESGVYRAEMLPTLLRQSHEGAVQKRKPLAVLRVAVDAFAVIEPDAAGEIVRLVADVVRDEIDYGESICRSAADEFMVLLSGRSVGEARALGERICVAIRKLGVPVNEEGKLKVSLGVAQMQPGERTPQLMLERSARALAKARQYGGNQVQAIASATV